MTLKAPKFQNVRVGDAYLDELTGRRYLVTQKDSELGLSTLWNDGSVYFNFQNEWNALVAGKDLLIDRNKTVTVRVSK